MSRKIADAEMALGRFMGLFSGEDELEGEHVEQDDDDAYKDEGCGAQGFLILCVLWARRIGNGPIRLPPTVRG